MIGKFLRICPAVISSGAFSPITRCSRPTKSIPNRTARRLALVLALAVSTAACDGAHGNDGDLETVRAGLVFDRVGIANQAGDVKLVGDLDGDGLLDLVLGGKPDEPLSWWRWPDLHLTTIAAAQVEFTTDGVLADADGDGDLDIVTADGPDGRNLIWFENPRPNGEPTDGAKWRRHEIGAIGSWGKDIKAADCDGDGAMDIVVRAPEQAMIFFRDPGEGWFRVALPPFDLGEEGMAIGDLDADGDTDIVLHGEWAENPGGKAARESGNWRDHRIGDFNPAFKALVVDIDRDGQADVLTSSSEHVADVTWFEPVEGPTGKWVGHVIEQSVPGAHTLQAADMDRDGDIDVALGQMHTTEARELAVLFNLDGRGTRWARQVIDNVGLHDGVVADVDRDGDFDIYGANWTGNPPAHIWVNRLDPAGQAGHIDRWTDTRITDKHVRSFGLSFADIDADGRTDIVSGPFWYRQPTDGREGEWEQQRIADNADAVATADVNGDGEPEILAQRGGEDGLEFSWFQLNDIGAAEFSEHPIGTVPSASHPLGSQGRAFAQIEPGGRPEFAVSSGGGVSYFTIPDDPGAGPWQQVRICPEASDEGIAFADMDGDGLPDLVATTGEAKEVAWWRNPGDGSPDWQRHEIDVVSEMVFPDRVAVGDFDGDGRTDVVVTEENGKPEGARAYWWHNPGDGGAWIRHEITTRGSLNSLSVNDMDGDGRPDIVMGEHRGALRLSIWHNLGGGFVEQLVGKGVESHLGAATVDLDGDGRLDIVSIAWDAPEAIHVFHNDGER